MKVLSELTYFQSLTEIAISSTFFHFPSTIAPRKITLFWAVSGLIEITSDGIPSLTKKDKAMSINI